MVATLCFLLCPVLSSLHICTATARYSPCLHSQHTVLRQRQAICFPFLLEGFEYWLHEPVRRGVCPTLPCSVTSCSYLLPGGRSTTGRLLLSYTEGVCHWPDNRVGKCRSKLKLSVSRTILKYWFRHINFKKPLWKSLKLKINNFPIVFKEPDKPYYSSGETNCLSCYRQLILP